MDRCGSDDPIRVSRLILSCLFLYFFILHDLEVVCWIGGDAALVPSWI